MQITIYYRDEDQYLVDQLEQKAQNERKSKSAVILSILEQYLESDKKIGEILCDLGHLSKNELQESLEIQEKDTSDKLIGEILIDNNFVEEANLERALVIQGKEV